MKQPFSTTGNASLGPFVTNVYYNNIIMTSMLSTEMYIIIGVYYIIMIPFVTKILSMLSTGMYIHYNRCLLHVLYHGSLRF